ncbi:MAG: hypothetical protein WDM78_05805 [Puia sp.]
MFYDLQNSSSYAISWRNFNYELDTTGQYIPISPNSVTSLDVTAVNIEQNSSREPFLMWFHPALKGNSS